MAWVVYDPYSAKRRQNVYPYSDGVGRVRPILFTLNPSLRESMGHTRPTSSGLCSPKRDPVKVKVAAPGDKIKKAFSDTLAFAMSLRETKMSLTPGLLKMFEQEDTKEWIQETLMSEHGLVCHWEVSGQQIIISGLYSDLVRTHDMFKEAFKKQTIKLEPGEACTLTSSAWGSFLDELRDSDSHPQPLLLPQGDRVHIVDTPSNISTTELKLKKILAPTRKRGKFMFMPMSHYDSSEG